jgi:hypothetical protein
MEDALVLATWNDGPSKQASVERDPAFPGACGSGPLRRQTTRVESREAPPYINHPD